MKRRKPNLPSRRDFLKTSVAGAAALGASLPTMSSLFRGRTAWAAEETALTEEVEKYPVLKVLRWTSFVQSEEDVWNANTRAWEAATGGKVFTDTIPWDELRPHAAMEAALADGHDIVLGWFDDPHLYPDKLLDLSDVAEPLGEKYGGWYPVCERYGKDSRTGRWIALPMACAGLCMNYRVSRLHQAGFDAFPQDVDGFVRCCKALKSKGHRIGLPLGHAVGDANSWTHWWLWSFGGKAVEADGTTVAVRSPETLQALDVCRELYETMIPGVEKWKDADNNQAFLSGDISLTNNGTSLLYSAAKDHPKINRDLATANYPVGPVGRPTELSLLTLAFVYRRTPAPKTAKHYLRFMMERPQYEAWTAGASGYITQTLKSYYDHASWMEDPRVTPFRECMGRMLWNGYEGPLGAASAAAMSEYVIVDLFAQVLAEKRSPKAAVLHAERKLAKMYGYLI
jgi:multiple sugar transport system substrate-binding protein